MHACPNCSAPLQEPDRFCARCGQKTHQHRFNLPHIFHEFFHAFTHADRGVLMLIRDLALRPGQVLREYIVEFRRARYFNPFTFLLLVLGFVLFINSVVKPYTHRPSPRSLAVQNTAVTVEVQPNGTDTTQISEASARQQRVSEWIEKRTNWMTFASIPITSLVFWLFYRRLHYAEHLVAQVVLAGFYMLVGALLIPLVLVPSLYNVAIRSGPLIFHAGYLTWAYGQFMGGNRFSGFLRAALASVCAVFLWSLVSGGLIFWYIANG